MKHHRSTILPFRVSALLLGAIACLAQAEAKKRPVAKGKKAKVSMFDPGELGATRGKFEVWKRGVLGGDAFYSRTDRELRGFHASINDKIHRAMIEDRIGDKDGWELIDETIAVGVKAKKQRGDTDALTASQRKSVSEELQKIATKAKALNNKVDQKLVTPVLNRKQVTTGELFRFGKTAEMISTAEAGTLERKAERLLDKESKAKSDGEITDRERESLIEEANDLSRDLIKALAR